MKTVDGLSITNECYHHYYMMTKNNGATAWLSATEPSILEPPVAGCINCGASKTVIVSTVIGGPYPSVGDSHGRGIMWLGSAWYRVEHKVFPCPICQEFVSADRMSELLLDSGLLESEYDWSIDFLRGKGKESVLDIIEKNLIGDGKGATGLYFLYGNYGVGKSGIMKSVVADSCQRGIKAIYRRASDILNEVKATFGDREKSVQQMLWKYARYKILAIDEIDRITSTDFSHSTMFQLLDERYNRRGQSVTMISANTDLEGGDFDYLVSRLSDGYRLVVGGQVMRGAGN